MIDVQNIVLITMLIVIVRAVRQLSTYMYVMKLTIMNVRKLCVAELPATQSIIVLTTRVHGLGEHQTSAKMGYVIIVVEVHVSTRHQMMEEIARMTAPNVKMEIV